MAALFLIAVVSLTLIVLIFALSEGRSQAYGDALYQSHIREVMRAGEEDASRAFQQQVIRHLISTGTGGDEDE